VIRKVFLLLLGFNVLGLMQTHTQPHGQSGDAAGPRAKIEVENDAVQVLRIHLAPHERIPIHEVTPRVVVWLTDAHLRDSFDDRTSRDVHVKSGDVQWVPAQRHAGENLGDRVVEFVAIVPKGHRSSAEK
jgi:beta-alanine degradation protein BauB